MISVRYQPWQLAIHETAETAGCPRGWPELMLWIERSGRRRAQVCPRCVGTTAATGWRRRFRSSCARQTALSRLSLSRLSPLFLCRAVCRECRVEPRVWKRGKPRESVVSDKQNRDGGHRRHHKQFGRIRSLHRCIPTPSGPRAAVVRLSGCPFGAYPARFTSNTRAQSPVCPRDAREGPGRGRRGPPSIGPSHRSIQSGRGARTGGG